MRQVRKSFLALVVLSVGLSAAAGAQETETKPAWDMSYEEIEAEVTKVRAGRTLHPASWPNGARVAVLLAFDVDNETDNMASGDMSIFSMSFHEYGARKGLGRILAALDEYDLPASFFIPAVSARLAPEMIPAIQESGRHEIAVHGWVHEWSSKISGEEEREFTRRAVEYLEQVTGGRPVGYRAPFGDVSDDILDIIRDMGFLYDSSLLADDTPYELLQNGKPTGMIELPLSFILEDSILHVANDFSGGILTPDDVLDAWKAEFDRAYEEGTTFLLITHPHIIGQRSRIEVLEQLIAHMKSRPNVWFATHRQAAEYVKQQLDGASSGQ